MRKILGGFIVFLLIGIAWASHEVRLFNTVTQTGPSKWVNVEGYPRKTLQVDISGTSATVALEGSAGGSGAPVTIASVTSSGAISNEDAWKEVRANVTACSACSVSAWLITEK